MQHLSRLRREHYDRLLPATLSVLEGGQIEFQAVPEGSPCLDRSLAELAFRTRTGATIMGVIRRERTIYNVPPDLRLEQRDTLMLLGGTEEIERARKLLHGHPD